MFTLAVLTIFVVLLPVVCIDLINESIDHEEIKEMGVRIEKSLGQ